MSCPSICYRCPSSPRSRAPVQPRDRGPPRRPVGTHRRLHRKWRSVSQRVRQSGARRAQGARRSRRRGGDRARQDHGRSVPARRRRDLPQERAARHDRLLAHAHRVPYKLLGRDSLAPVRSRPSRRRHGGRRGDPADEAKLGEERGARPRDKTLDGEPSEATANSATRSTSRCHRRQPLGAARRHGAPCLDGRALRRVEPSLRQAPPTLSQIVTLCSIHKAKGGEWPRVVGRRATGEPTRRRRSGDRDAGRTCACRPLTRAMDSPSSSTRE